MKNETFLYFIGIYKYMKVGENMDSKMDEKLYQNYLEGNKEALKQGKISIDLLDKYGVVYTKKVK